MVDTDRDSPDGETQQEIAANADLVGSAPCLIPPLANYERFPDVTAELQRWYSAAPAEQASMLSACVQGTSRLNRETLVHISSQAYGNGDERILNKAFEALIKLATPGLLRMLSGSVDERQEQAQDILMDLFRAIRGGKSDFAEANFTAWAKRRTSELNRKRRATLEGSHVRAQPTAAPESEEQIDPLDQLPAGDPSPETLALLGRHMDALKPHHRAAFIQRHFLGMTQEEIAQHHDVDVRTIRKWLKIANAKLDL